YSECSGTLKPGHSRKTRFDYSIICLPSARPDRSARKTRETPIAPTSVPPHPCSGPLYSPPASNHSPIANVTECQIRIVLAPCPSAAAAPRRPLPTVSPRLRPASHGPGQEPNPCPPWLAQARSRTCRWPPPAPPRTALKLC